MRYASCLNPSLETGRDEARALEERRQRFWWIRRTGTQIERDLEEKESEKILLQKVRSYKDGEEEGVILNTEKIPKLREKWGQMYEWIFEPMRYIDGMAGWDIKALRTSRIKAVIQEAAGIRYPKGAES